MMKKYVLLFSLLFSLSACADDFDTEWKGIIFQKDSGKKLDGLVSLYRKYEDSEKYILLPDLLRLEYKFGSLDELKKYYQKSLGLASDFKGEWNTGNVLHSAHNYMGSALVDKKNYSEGLPHLDKSCKVASSPQLRSYGPDMLLAKKLLEAGFRDEVMAHLKDCKNIWKRNDGILDSWISSIKGGGSPYFLNNIQ